MIVCKECDFRLSSLSIEINVGAAQGDSPVPLTCPVCGARVEMKLEQMRVYCQKGEETQHFYWDTGDSAPPRKTPVGWKLQVDRMVFTFATLTKLEPKAICYNAVPAFKQSDGKLRFPLLPVKEEYFDCVDVDVLEKLSEDELRGLSGLQGGRYQARIPLKGLGGAYAKVAGISVINADPEAAPGTPEAHAFRGVNLRMWPRVEFKEWRTYLIGLSAASEEGAKALKGERLQLRAAYRTRQDDKWTHIEQQMRDGEAVTAATDGRPRWLLVEVADSQRGSGARAAVAGGVLSIPAATQTCKGLGQLDLAIDFGTSNTCLALRDTQRRPQLLPRADVDQETLYLMHAGPDSTEQRGPDLWPAQQWFGPKQDLFPSELLFLEQRDAVEQQLGDIEKWRFGVDFGVPGAGVDVLYDEAAHLLAHFKWNSMLQASAPGFVSNIEELQACYLEAVLTCAVARVLASGRTGIGTVQVIWSYPVTFQQDDMTTLSSAMSRTAERLAGSTGMVWQQPQPGANESAAASYNAGDPDADVAIYADMGGGSTDIAIENPAQSHRDSPTPLFITSVKYAGANLLEAYAGDGTDGTSCLNQDVGVDSLRRRIREAKRIMDVVGNPRLFNKTFAKQVKTRTKHFYSYIIEYTARMLASAILDKRAFRDQEPSEELRVAIYFLGNGWGFGGILDNDIHDLLMSNVQNRVVEILQNTSEAQEALVDDLKAVDVEVEVLFDTRIENLPHNKAAVAFGLLSGEGLGESVSTGKVPRGVVGYTTHVGKDRSIPWFRPCGKDPPRGEKKLRDHDNLRWQENEKPDFDDGIAPPAELDPGLNRIRLTLQRSCPPSSRGWFERSPFEVMLEDLFATKLPGLSGGHHGRR